MNLFVINTHSFSSLVTNSSSELFICDTQKSVEMVRELLQKLLKNHNELIGQDIYKFDECFGNIEVAQYDFSLPKMSALYKKWLQYEKYRDYYSEDLGRPASLTLAEEKQKQLDKVHPYYTTKWSDYNKMDDEENKKRAILFQDYLGQQNKIWTQYGSEKLALENEIFLEFLKINDFTETSLKKVRALAEESVANHLKDYKGEYTHILGGRPPNNLMNAYINFSEYFSWNMEIKKGQILVYSRGDNSIPYELFDLISNYLNAQRYHLG
jgi:hypothetical protein